MKKIILITLMSFLFFACGSRKLTSDKELLAFKNAIENNKLSFEATSANPVAFANVRGLERLLPPGSNVASINLVNNPNYFRVKNDSISFDLPYYGELQIGMGYNRDTGLKFEGTPEKAKVDFNSRKEKYTITYTVRTENENLRMFLVLFPNKTARLDVNSSNRTSIFYYGDWKVLE